MKIKTKFMFTVTTVLLIGVSAAVVWTSISSYKSTLNFVTNEATNLSESIRGAIYGIMGSGQQDFLDKYLNNARKLDQIREIRIIRSGALDKEVGAKKDSGSQDDIDRQVLASGQEIFNKVVVDHDRGIRRVIPIRAAQVCLSCHTQEKENDVMAAMSLTISYQSGFNALIGNIIRSVMIQLTMILLVLASIFVLFRKFIMRPVRKIEAFSEQLEDGNLNARVAYGSRDEMGMMALKLDSFVLKMGEVVLRIRSGSDQLLAASKGISESSEEISDGAQQQSTHIEQFTNSVQANDSNVKSANQAAQEVTQKAQTARQAADNTKMIIENVKMIADELQKIASATQQQAGTSQENMTIVESNAAAAEQLAASAQEMSSQAQLLHDLVRQFKVDEREFTGG